MRKFLIIAIAFIPFAIANAENTQKTDTEKASTSEITAPQAEKTNESKVAEKPADKSKKQKMGKAGGKGG